MSTDKKKYNFLTVFPKIAPIQFRSSPLLNTSNIIIGVFHAAGLALTIIATQQLFDTITRAAVGNASFADCIPPLLL